MTWEGCDEPTGCVARLDVARPRGNYRLRCHLDCRAQRRGHDVRQLTHSGQEGPGRAEGREPGGGELPRYVGTPNTPPDSRTPRRLTTVMIASVIRQRATVWVWVCNPGSADI